MRTTERVCVVFNSGLGNGLLLIPMVRALRAQGCEVTGIFSSPFISEEVIAPLGVLDEIVSIRPGWRSLMRFGIRHFKRYARTYLDYTSSSPMWLAVSALISGKVLCNRRKWYFRCFPNVKYIEPLPGGHIILQQLQLAGLAQPSLPGPDIYQLQYSDAYRESCSGLVPGEEYAILQLSAANNSVQFKNWPLTHWVEFLRLLTSRYPKARILLTGDDHEVEYGEFVEAAGIPGVVSLIGKTSFRELISLIAGCTHYIGLDSGTMHLAAMMGKPTFVLWGPSDPQTIGYAVFDPQRHCDVSMQLACSPCFSWIGPNRSLVSHPAHCLHQRCIRGLEPKLVFGAYLQFAERNDFFTGLER